MKRGKSILKTTAYMCLIFFSVVSYASNNQTKPDATETVKNQESISISEDKKTQQPNLKSHTQIGASNYIQMLGGLFFIVIFIFTVAWLIKRMGSLNPAQSGNLKVVAGLNVGQREKIIVLQVMDEQLLVGVTQSNIQLLTKLEKPVTDQSFSVSGGFQSKLQSAINSFTNKTDTEKK